MIKYFKCNHIYYKFDLSSGAVERWVFYKSTPVRTDTRFTISSLNSSLLRANYQEISEIEFNSIFEL